MHCPLVVGIYWSHILKVTLSITNKYIVLLYSQVQSITKIQPQQKPKRHTKGQHSLHTHLCTYQTVNPSVLVCESMMADAAPPHSLNSSPLKQTEDMYQ